MLNRVILMGRLCADPELRQTPNGVSTCRISIAVDHRYANKQTGERGADFINVVCWRQTAEFVTRYFHKGSMIIVEGSLQNNNYTDQNGMKHYCMDVVADNVSFGETKRAAEQNGGYQGAYQQPTNSQPQQSYGQPSYQQPAASTNPTNDSVQLGSLDDFEEILSDGEVPF
ncbi:MAG: single-stranded DNA-binding protein [Ruminococcus sp.]|nr:single-stranded DNA-binding protein [Ruminococcus sp.]